MAITDEAMLIMVSAQQNNNKFYHVTLTSDGTVTKRWGRVGTDGTQSTERTGLGGFQRIISAKQKKGYVKTDVITLAENDGQQEKLSKIAHTALVNKESKPDAVITELVDTLVKLNNHDILETSGGMIKINNSGLITTPLGLISQNSISCAKTLLNKLEQTPTNTDMFSGMLEDYLRLIPQKVGARRGWEKEFFKEENSFVKQQDFLKQLSDSLSLQADRKKVQVEENDNTDDDESKYEKLFRFHISLCEDSKEFKRIEEMFEKGKSSYHPGSHLKLKKIYSLEDQNGNDAYNEALNRLGTEYEVWHGTRAHNLLSILRKNLYCPPLRGSTIQIQGRAFGSGVYLSPAAVPASSSRFLKGKTTIVPGGSSKSLNYSLGGVWDNGPRDNRCFMLLGKAVMGRIFNPQGSWGSFSDDAVQKSGKYDSIHAKPGQTGLKNDEIIIWNTNQISLNYICEFGL